MIQYNYLSVLLSAKFFSIYFKTLLFGKFKMWEFRILMFSFHHYKTFFLIPDILLILKFTLFDIDRATPTFLIEWYYVYLNPNSLLSNYVLICPGGGGSGDREGSLSWDTVGYFKISSKSQKYSTSNWTLQGQGQDMSLFPN